MRLLAALVALSASTTALATVAPLPSDRVALCFDRDNLGLGCENERTLWWVLRDDLERAAQNAGPPPKPPEEKKPQEPKEPYHGDWSLAANMGYGEEHHGPEATATGYILGGKIQYKLFSVDLNWLTNSQNDYGNGNGNGAEARVGFLVPVYQRFGAKLVASASDSRRMHWMDGSSPSYGVGAEAVFAGPGRALTIGVQHERTGNYPGANVTDYMGVEHSTSDIRPRGVRWYVEFSGSVIGDHQLWHRRHHKKKKKKETP
ncbi:MAG TPA: hypothetical protein VM598_11500 [Bdellovibrionota bacterium]|nr:hypothetical protein [Bdellovibrionota bacterium]